MSDEIEPVVENWYRNVDEDLLFEVIDIDNDIIEIRYYGGEAEEIDFETWEEMELEFIENPEDWIGGYNDIDEDDWDDEDDDDDDDDEDEDDDDWDEERE